MLTEDGRRRWTTIRPYVGLSDMSTRKIARALPWLVPDREIAKKRWETLNISPKDISFIGRN